MRQFNLVYDGKYKFIVKANGVEISSIKYMVEDWEALAHLQKIKSTIKDFSTSFDKNEPNILFQWFGTEHYQYKNDETKYTVSLYTCKDPKSNLNCVCLKYEPNGEDGWPTSRTILTVPIISKKRILKDFNLIIAKLDEEIKWYAELEKPNTGYSYFDPFFVAIREFNQLQKLKLNESDEQKYNFTNIPPKKFQPSGIADASAFSMLAMIPEYSKPNG